MQRLVKAMEARGWIAYDCGGDGICFVDPSVVGFAHVVPEPQEVPVTTRIRVEAGPVLWERGQ